LRKFPISWVWSDPPRFYS